MQLFYTPNITFPIYELPEEESAHSIRVLRLTEGDLLHMTDGRGNLYTAQIVTANPKRTTVRIIESIPQFEKRNYNLTVAIAPTKNTDRLEWFLEKATETGIDRIIPIMCDHSERRTIRPDRHIRVITSAMKQSLKAFHPVLDEMTPMIDVIAAASPAATLGCANPRLSREAEISEATSQAVNAGVAETSFRTGMANIFGGTGFQGRKLIAHCREGHREFIGDVLNPGNDALILIGPEGDFSSREVEAAVEAGFIPVTLGRSRLRTETAALAAVTIAAFINK